MEELFRLPCPSSRRSPEEPLRCHRRRLRSRRRPVRLYAVHGGRESSHARGRAQILARNRDADVPDAGSGAASRAGDAGQALRFLRRDGGRRLEVPGEPYMRASEDDAGRFDWWRARMLGGRTNHWGRISLRNGPYDFKPRTRDGLGFDWPIAYEDLAPYYDKVELLIGVYGSNEGLENTPNSPPGCLLPPPHPLVSDLLVAQRSKRLGIPVIPGHRAVLTQPLDFRSSPARLHPGNLDGAADSRRGYAQALRLPLGDAVRARLRRSVPTISRPPSICRRRSAPATSISRPTPWSTRSRWGATAGQTA